MAVSDDGVCGVPDIIELKVAIGSCYEVKGVTKLLNGVEPNIKFNRLPIFSHLI